MTRHQRRRYTIGAKIFLAVYTLALVAAIAGVVHYV
ncbi:membrane protein [Salmonella phage Skate]|uniref:Membrane protein n=1 Tax=Salmonella phage Skate TaxID=2234035 RepID=A0A2Z5HSE9_9CAUD|nr:membrane protein [Salmonella phage Skate]AXC43045.1 membrane protein [Salmonella phage Skate]